MKNYGQIQQNISLAGSLDRNGNYYKDINHIQKALEYQLISLKMKRQILEQNNHPHIASTLNNIAICYQNLGDYQMAQKYSQGSLQMIKQISKEDHVVTAYYLSQAGKSYIQLGQHQKALKMYIKSLKIYQQNYKEYHPCVSKAFIQVGFCYSLLGDRKMALEYLIKYIEMIIYEDYFHHPDIQQFFKNIEQYFFDLDEKDLQNKLEYFDLYEFIQEQNDSFIQLTEIIFLKKCQKRLIHLRVLKSQFQLYEMSKQILQGDHTYIATSLNKIGTSYQDLGYFQKASAYFTQSLEMFQQIPSENNFKIIKVLNDLGICYQMIGDNEKALHYLQECLFLEEQVQNDDEMNAAISLNNIGTCFKGLGNYEKALEYALKSFESFKLIYKESHPLFSTILNNVAICYKDSQNNTQALEYLLQSLKYNQEFHSHIDIAISLNNVGQCYCTLGDNQKALKYSLEALEMKRQFFKDNNPMIANQVGNIALFYNEIGDKQIVFEYIQKYLQICEEINENNKNNLIITHYKNICNLPQNEVNQQKIQDYLLRQMEIHQMIFQETEKYNKYQLKKILYGYQTLISYENSFSYLKNQYTDKKMLKFKRSNPQLITSLQIVQLNEYQDNSERFNHLIEEYQTINWRQYKEAFLIEPEYSSNQIREFQTKNLELLMKNQGKQVFFEQWDSFYHLDLTIIKKIIINNICLKNEEPFQQYLSQNEDIIETNLEKAQQNFIEIEKINFPIKEQMMDELIEKIRKQGVTELEENIKLEIFDKLKEKNYFMGEYLAKGGQGYIFEGYKQISENSKEEVVFKYFLYENKEEIEEEIKIMDISQNIINAIKMYDYFIIEKYQLGIFVLESCQYSLFDELILMKAKKQNFSITHLLKIIFELLDGLIQLRVFNILHLDIKPANILISKQGNYLYSDFGLSTIKKQNQFSKIKGFTIHYSPQEQLNQEIEKIDFGSDIFSLGRTFLRILDFYEKYQNEDDYLNKEEIQKIKEIAEDMTDFSVSQRYDCLDLHKSFINFILSIENQNVIKQFFQKYLIKIIQILELKIDNDVDISFYYFLQENYIEAGLKFLIKFVQGQNKIKGEFNNKYGLYQLRQGFIEDALKHFYDSLSFFEQNDEISKAKCLYYIGICHYYLNQYKFSHSYLQQSLNIQIESKIKGIEKILLTKNYLTICKQKMGQSRQHLKDFYRSLDQARKSFDKNQCYVSYFLTSLGLKQYLNADFSNSLKSFTEAHQIILDNCQNQYNPDLAQSLNNLGIAYFYLSNYHQSMQSFLKSLEISRKINRLFQEQQAISLYNIGMIQNYLGNYDDSLSYFQESTQIFLDQYPKYSSKFEFLINRGFFYLHHANFYQSLVCFVQSLEFLQDIFNIDYETTAYSYLKNYDKKQYWIKSQHTKTIKRKKKKISPSSSSSSSSSPSTPNEIVKNEKEKQKKIPKSKTSNQCNNQIKQITPYKLKKNQRHTKLSVYKEPVIQSHHSSQVEKIEKQEQDIQNQNQKIQNNKITYTLNEHSQQASSEHKKIETQQNPQIIQKNSQNQTQTQSNQLIQNLNSLNIKSSKQEFNQQVQQIQNQDSDIEKILKQEQEIQNNSNPKTQNDLNEQTQEHKQIETQQNRSIIQKNSQNQTQSKSDQLIENLNNLTQTKSSKQEFSQIIQQFQNSDQDNQSYDEKIQNNSHLKSLNEQNDKTQNQEVQLIETTQLTINSKSSNFDNQQIQRIDSGQFQNEKHQQKSSKIALPQISINKDCLSIRQQNSQKEQKHDDQDIFSQQQLQNSKEGDSVIDNEATFKKSNKKNQDCQSINFKQPINIGRSIIQTNDEKQDNQQIQNNVDEKINIDHESQINLSKKNNTNIDNNQISNLNSLLQKDDIQQISKKGNLEIKQNKDSLSIRFEQMMRNKVKSIVVQMNVDSQKKLDNQLIKNKVNEKVNVDGEEKVNSSQLKQIQKKNLSDQFTQCLNYLENKLKGKSESNQLLETIYNIAGVGYYILGNSQSQLQYFLKSLEIQKKLNRGLQIDAAALHNNLGISYCIIGDYKTAMQHYQKSAQIKKQLFQCDQLCSFVSTSNIAICYQKMSDYQNSFIYHQQSHEMLMGKFKQNNLQIVISYNNLGSYYQQIGDYSNSLKNYKSCINIIEEFLQKNGNYFQQSCLNNLAVCYINLGLFEKASISLQDLMKISMEISDQSKVQAAIRLKNLGMLHHQQQTHKEALKYFQESLDLVKEIKSENQQLIATCFNYIGISYQKLGNFDMAFQNMNQSFQIRNKIFPKKHPDISNSFNSLGLFYLEINQIVKADKYLMKSLDIRKQLFEKKNLFFAESLNNFGCLLLKSQNKKQALEYLLESFEIRKQIGQVNPFLIAESLFNIGICYLNLNDKQQSNLFLKESINIFQKNPLHMFICMNNLGQYYLESGNYQEAQNYLSSSLQIAQKNNEKNENLKNVLSALNSIALCHFQFQDYKKAIENFNEIISQTDEKQDEYYFAILKIGSCYQQLGSYQQAIQYFYQALNIIYRQSLIKLERISDIYNYISSCHFSLGNYSKALLYQLESLDIIHIINVEKKKSYMNIVLLSNLNMCYLKFGQINQAIKQVNNIIDISNSQFKENQLDAIHSLYNLGLAFLNSKQIRSAEKIYLLFQDKSKLNQNDNSQVYFLHFFGIYKKNLQEYQIAIEYLNDSYVLAEKQQAKNQIFIAEIKNNLGECYYQIGKYQIAMINFQKCYESSVKLLNLSHQLVIASRNNIANCLLIKECFRQALKYFQENLITLQEEYGLNHIDTATCHYNIGICQLKNNNAQIALNHFLQSIQIKHFNKIDENHPSLEYSFKNIAICYHLLNDPQKSLEFMCKSNQIAKINFKMRKNQARSQININLQYQFD